MRQQRSRSRWKRPAHGRVQRRNRDIERLGLIAETALTLGPATGLLGYHYESTAMDIATDNYAIVPSGLAWRGAGVVATAGTSEIHSPYLKLAGTAGKFTWHGGLKYFRFEDAASTGFTTGPAPDFALIRAPDLDRSARTHDTWLPTLWLAYDLTPEVQAHGSWGRGFIRPYAYLPLVNTYSTNRAALRAAGVPLKQLFDGTGMEESENGWCAPGCRGPSANSRSRPPCAMWAGASRMPRTGRRLKSLIHAERWVSLRSTHPTAVTDAGSEDAALLPRPFLPLSVPEVLAALAAGPSGPDTAAHVIWSIRLPRLLAAVLAGMGLAVAGAAMQSALHNPLASPLTLGVSQGAALGATCAIVLLGAGELHRVGPEALTVHRPSLVALAALAGGLGTAAAILAIATLRRLRPEALVLAGIALGAFSSAGTMAVQYFAAETQVAASLFWTFGD